MVLYHQLLNHVQFHCHLRVVVVVDTQRNRRALLFSTDVVLDALPLYRYDKAGLDHGIGHFRVAAEDSEARAATPPIPKSTHTSTVASDRNIAPRPSSRQAA